MTFQDIKNKETGCLTNKMLLTYLYLEALLEEANKNDILKESQILHIVLDKKVKNLSVSTKFTLLANETFEGLEGLESFQLNKNGNSSIHISNSFFKCCNDLSSIDLSNCNLKSVDINLIADLPKLIKLNLSSNKIREIIPLKSECKAYLKELNLKNNNLSNFFDHLENSVGCFDGCHSLESIDLSENKLISIDFLQFSVLKLKTLNLSDNQIRELVNSSKEKITTLKSLNLSNNNLKIIRSQFISLLDELNYLDLSKNNLEMIESEAFHNLFELNHLDLSENEMTHLEPFLFYNLGSLKVLDLSKNQLKEVKEDYFAIKQSKLSRLDLSFNTISSYEKNSFTYLMGFNSSYPADNAKLPEGSCIEMINLVENIKTTPYHTDYDRKRSCFPRYLPRNSKYFNNN